MIVFVFAPIVAVLTLDSVFAGVVAEAFSSIAWAATAALAASASWAVLGTALVAFGVLGAVWLISPSRA